MELGIQGRTAAVAAGSAGLGLGSAAALVAEGVRVAVCGRDEARLERAARELGDGAVPIVADVGSEEGAAGFVRQAIQALGHVDILVPNAGGPPPGSATGTSLAAYRSALELNLLSSIAMCQEAVGGMRERGWGRIVAITSTGARAPIPFLAASVTARTGLTGYLKTLASEVACDGVTVNSVQPGIHDTDRVRQLGRVEDMARGIPTGTVGDAGDFGKLVAFLCSEPARFITGTSVLVDGGAYPGL